MGRKSNRPQAITSWRKGYQKYHAKPVWMDFKGKQVYIRSQKQALRLGELLWLERAGAISNLAIEVPFEMYVNGIYICSWKVDATYIEKEKKVAEEVKGKELADFIIKRNLLFALYPDWEYRQI